MIGVATKIGRGNNDGDNQRLYIPLTTMLELFPMTGENVPQDAVTSIQYQPTDSGAERDGEGRSPSRHRRRGMASILNVKDAFEEWDTIKSERTVGLIFTAMDVFLGGVGIVTLALGAVGIINIMLVTVTERTKEIGLRKALGATNRSILIQFFLEGLMLTGLSGLIGIIAGAATADVRAGYSDGKQRDGVRSAAAGAVVGSDGDGNPDAVRCCRRALSGEQGCDVGAG